MAWSTRELADLAGTTVKAVRHYHAVGLLDEPSRRANGYKQYGAAHLVRLLQIKRLADLGVPLARIGGMARADARPVEALRELDAELAASIDRLQRVRDEVAALLRDETAIDLPAGFAAAAGTMSAADRSMVSIYARVFDDTAMADLQRLVAAFPRTDADDDFDALPADADVATRKDLAQRMAPGLARQLDEHPWLRDPAAQSRSGAADAQTTVVAALRELYSPAQLDVLARAHAIATAADEEPEPAR